MQTSTAPTQAPAASSGLRQVMRQHPLVSYFVLAYAFAWILALPYVLSTWHVIPAGYGVLMYALKTWGPGLAAITVTGITLGKAGLLRLWDRIRQWRASWLWYLFILLVIPVLFLLGMHIIPGASASLKGLTPSLLVSYPIVLVAVFLGTGLGEELGWRGFALPRMQPRFGPLGATLLLGVLWGFWHALYFLTPGHGGGPGTSFATVLTNFAILLLITIALAIIMTWVFNHTRGSIFIAGLLHASVDTPQAVFLTVFVSAAVETRIDLACLIALGVPALLIVLLTRGRLGYQPSEVKDGREQAESQGESPSGTAAPPLLVH